MSFGIVICAVNGSYTPSMAGDVNSLIPEHLFRQC